MLCYLEGRSNSEAAALLGCPRGTVDSRLAAARQKLYQRLVSRGVTLSGVAALATVWQGEGQASAASLTARTVAAVAQFTRTGSAAGTVSSHVLSLVAGVCQTMTANKLSVVVALAIGLSLLGGAGYTAFYASADPPKLGDKKAAEKPKAAAAGPADTTLDTKPPTTEREILALLRKSVDLKQLGPQMPLRDLLEFLSDRFDVPIRIDLAAFARMKVPQAVELYDRPIKLPMLRGMTVGDVLREAAAQVPVGGDEAGSGGTQVTFRIRNGQIAIVPAYVPFIPSVGGGATGSDDQNTQLTGAMILEQEEGEPITVAIDEMPFTEVLQELRRITGANIVLDSRQKEKAKQTVTATLNDVPPAGRAAGAERHERSTARRAE